MPAAGALLQGFIEPFLVLLDEAFQTDIPADFEAHLEVLQEQKKPRNAPVPITEWVDAEEIQVKGGQEHKIRSS